MVTAASAKEIAYQKKVKQLANSIHARATASNENITLLKDTSNLFRHRQKKNNQIDARSFNRVISVDKENLIAVVEGMTTFEDLVSETLKHDCMPQVVPELKTITIGGALSGIGIESSSFRYGLVHETITQFDVLLPDGSVKDCNPNNEYRDLFYAIPNSYGTLGYVLKVTVRLIPIKKYVKLKYQHFSDPDKFIATLNDVCLKNRKQGDIAFIEGVVFNKDHMVISSGQWSDQAHEVSNYKFMNIYFRAIEKRNEDYLTAEDFIWRWDTDWFWCSKVFKLQNPVVRFLLGKWMLKSRVYSKLMRLTKKNKILNWLSAKFEKPSESVIQDVTIPIDNARTFLDFFQENIGIRPFWICPIHPADENAHFSLFKMKPNQLYLNFGFWDIVPSPHQDGYFNRLIERKVEELGGNKSLYSNAFYTADEFWEIYDKPLYDNIKNKYDPENSLSNLYSKCVEKTNGKNQQIM